MEKMILSLKNIYMILMTEDFPIYSESVISRNDRKGQTMLRFWQNQIAEEFRCLPCGKMIWRNDGKRNRYTSYLCNRSAEIKTYSEYAGELASQVSIPALLNQIGRFREFLSARKYRHDILLRRIQELVRLTEAEDPRVSGEIANQIREAAAWQPEDARGYLFQASYLLTVMMLYAAAGEAMDDPIMAVLRAKKYSLDCLWNACIKPPKEEQPVVFLTAHSGLLQDNPLPPHRFFGREEELFNLKEIAASGRKCLITGIGGIGKTELLRQILRWCCETHAVDKIAVIPYETGIAESVSRCFAQLQQPDPDDSLRMARNLLKKESEEGSVLLLIDDLTNTAESDPNLKGLAELPCGVLITTRLTALEGFETYALEAPAVRTSALIFRDNYGSPLRPADHSALTEMLEDPALCHPLTLRLMAKAARSRGWSVQELADQLDKNASLSWQEEGRTVRLSQVYRQLYSWLRLPKECQDSAELYTLLPRGSYSPEFLQKWFPSIFGDDAPEKLEVLTEGGWLERDETGFSMHPLVVQCLRRKTITEDRVSRMLASIQDWLLRIPYVNGGLEEDEEVCRIVGIFIHVCQFLSGSVSRDLTVALLTAMCYRIPGILASEQMRRFLEQFMRRCPERDDLVEILYYTILGRRMYIEEEETDEAIRSAFRRQKQTPTVSRPCFLNFCLAAGSHLTFRQDFDNAEMILREVLCQEAHPSQKACAYFELTGVCNSRGDAETAMQWARRGADYALSEPACGKFWTFRILAMLCQYDIKYGRQEPAETILRQIRELNLVQDSPNDRSQFAYMAGLYEWKYGDAEKALAYTNESLQIVELYEGVGGSYFLHLGQIAGIYSTMERYDEALAVYTDLLDQVHKYEIPALINLYSINIAPVLLKLHQPKKALEHLNEVLDAARNQGGLMLAENQRNRAQAFEQLGDTQQEYACLKEASPLLTVAYGPDHPRSAAARERLEALTTIME